MSSVRARQTPSRWRRSGESIARCKLAMTSPRTASPRRRQVSARQRAAVCTGNTDVSVGAGDDDHRESRNPPLAGRAQDWRGCGRGFALSKRTSRQPYPADDDGETGRTEDGKDLAGSSRRVGNESFPDSDGCVTNDSDRVLTHDVDSSEDTIATLFAESIDECLLGRVHAGRDVFLLFVFGLFLLLADLAADSGDSEQEVSNERDRPVRWRESQSVRGTASERKVRRVEEREIRTIDGSATLRRTGHVRVRGATARWPLNCGWRRSYVQHASKLRGQSRSRRPSRTERAE